MTVPTLQLSDMAGHIKPVHFYQGVFSCTNTVPLYRLPFQNDTTNVMTLAHVKSVCTPAHIPPSRRTQISGTRLPRAIRHLSFVGAHYGTCFMSPFWQLKLWGGS